MNDREAHIRIVEALCIHLDALADAIEAGDELVPDRGQYDHARDVVRRYAATDPSPPSAN